MLFQSFGERTKSTNNNWYYRHFHVPQLFKFLCKIQVLIPFSHSFDFTLCLAGTAKSTILQVLIFSLIIIRSGRLAEIWWSVCISKSQRSLCVSFSKTNSGWCMYHLFVWSNFNFLHHSQWITLPTQSCLVLYSFCANLRHSLIMWLIVSFISPYYQHLLFCCVLSILALIWLVFMALFCASVRRDTVSFLTFPVLSRVHVFPCEMSLVSRLKRPYRCFSSHFSFSGYCRSASPRVVSIVSGGCNQFSSVLLYLVFDPLYRCVHAVSNLLDTCSLWTSSIGCNTLCMVISFLVLWSICWSSSLVHFKNSTEYLTRRTTPAFIPLTRLLL